jgi:ribose 5-phosphate isomerase A
LRAVEKAISGVQVLGPMKLRQTKEGHPFVTDGGHWIVDAALGRIDDPRALAHALSGVPGVMEHGLFIDLASVVIVGGPDGVKTVERPASR